eukprot:360411-Chlamydomonas_euryale.AAC.2
MLGICLPAEPVTCKPGLGGRNVSPPAKMSRGLIQTPMQYKTEDAQAHRCAPSRAQLPSNTAAPPHPPTHPRPHFHTHRAPPAAARGARRRRPVRPTAARPQAIRGHLPARAPWRRRGTKACGRPRTGVRCVGGRSTTAWRGPRSHGGRQPGGPAHPPSRHESSTGPQSGGPGVPEGASRHRDSKWEGNSSREEGGEAEGEEGRQLCRA